MRRVANWLTDEKARDRRSVAITHSTIIRATIVHVMDAPPQSFWCVDIGPLSVTCLSSSGGAWKISFSGCMLRDTRGVSS
jgi:broad specificity phosphatase PhoE